MHGVNVFILDALLPNVVQSEGQVRREADAFLLFFKD
jgi:hypothetical protein